MEIKKDYKCLKKNCGVSYTAEKLGPCPVCGEDDTKLDRNKNNIFLISFLIMTVISIVAWQINKSQLHNKDEVKDEEEFRKVTDIDIKAKDEIAIAKKSIEPEIITPETTTEFEEADNNEEVPVNIKLNSGNDRIKEFQTYYSLNGEHKVNHFIDKVIDLKYSKPLSEKELKEFNSILQDAFSEFYKISGQLDQETICEQLSSFISEFKNNGVTMDQNKYEQLKARGDDC